MTKPTPHQRSECAAHESMCIDCGVKPRPKRTNWHRVPWNVDVDPYHHRCHDCYERWNAQREANGLAMATSYLMDECASTPSRKTVTARKAHECRLCDAAIEPKTQYWAFTVPGPRTVKVCAGCAANIVQEAA